MRRPPWLGWSLAAIHRFGAGRRYGEARDGGRTKVVVDGRTVGLLDFHGRSAKPQYFYRRARAVRSAPALNRPGREATLHHAGDGVRLGGLLSCRHPSWGRGGA